MNFEAQYNEVVEHLNVLYVRHKTNWVKQLDGSIRGDGLYIYENPNLIRTSNMLGNCVADNLQVYVKMYKAGAKFYQGEIRTRIGDWKHIDNNRGMPVYHCWVEMGDKVYDYANGDKKIIDRDVYYIMVRVKLAEEVPIEVIDRGNKREVIMNETKRQRFYKKIIDKQQKLGYIKNC